MNNSTQVATSRAITVPFHGADLFVVEHNGQPYTPMKPIVEGIGLDWGGQHKKVAANESRWGISVLEIPSAGGVQLATCILLRKLPAWLATVEPGKVKNPEVRARVIQYQNECDDVLWQYWNDGLAINPRATRPHNPAIDYDRISPAQAQDLKELVHSIVDSKVQGFAETWARLHKRFRVNSYLELPATRFEEARDYLLGKLPPEAAAPSQPVNPLNAPELTAARKVAEEYFDNFRAAVKAGTPNPAMGEIPHAVLQGMVSRAVLHQRTLSWFDWQTGSMHCKLVESDASVFSLTSGDYNDLMERVPMERLPEMAEAINRRVANHLGAFSQHLQRSRKPAANGAISLSGVMHA